MTSIRSLPFVLVACLVCVGCPTSAVDPPVTNQPTATTQTGPSEAVEAEPAWLAEVKAQLRDSHDVSDEGERCRRDMDCDSPLRCSDEAVCDWPIAMTGEADENTPRVIINTGGETHEFLVEIADDGAEQQRGMMDRHIVQPGFGMVFIFSRDAPRSFWMRNCHVYLDIIYVTSGGVIDSIAENAVPESDRAHFRESTNRYPSDGPARFVIEIAGGESERLGIEPGDRVSFENFPPGVL